MKPFYFTHPQYGKLRVVVIGGKIYYCLMDVKNIFKKSVHKLDDTTYDTFPALAKCEPQKGSDTEYIVPLRYGAKLSDGTPVKASYVVSSYKRSMIFISFIIMMFRFFSSPSESAIVS